MKRLKGMRTGGLSIHKKSSKYAILSISVLRDIFFTKKSLDRTKNLATIKHILHLGIPLAVFQDACTQNRREFIHNKYPPPKQGHF